MNEILKLILISSGAVVYLFLLSKVLGKKQIAQLDFIDYVLGISVGSIAAEMATDLTERPWYYYVISMTVFLIFNILIIIFERKGPILKHFFKGRPCVVIYEGKIDFKQLKRSGLDMNELISLCRDKNYFDLNQIAYAIFENCGKLSVMPKSAFKPPVLQDMGIESAPASLPNCLVIDGKISYSTLTELKKDPDWLYQKLNINSKKELKNIIFATYDANTDTITPHYKSND